LSAYFFMAKARSVELRIVRAQENLPIAGRRQTNPVSMMRHRSKIQHHQQIIFRMMTFAHIYQYRIIGIARLYPLETFLAKRYFIKGWLTFIDLVQRPNQVMQAQVRTELQ